MIEGYSASRQTSPGEWQGLFFQLRPTPSGFERHILRFSTQTRYPTGEEAAAEIQAAVDRMNGAHTSPSVRKSESEIG